MGESWEGGAATEQPNLELDTQTAGTGSTDSISIPALTEQEHTLTALTDFLDLDNRPTFIVDLGSSPSGNLFYHNASLAELTYKEVEVGRQVLEGFGKDFKGAKAIPFLYWVQTVDRPASSIAYLDVLWTSKTIRQKWRVITGTIQPSPQHKRRESVSFEAPRLSRQSTAPIHGRVPTTSFPAHHTLDPQMSAFPSHREQVPTYPPAERTAPRGYEPLGRFDMTGPNPQVPKSSFTDFFLAFDWASTAIGPMNLWSPLLRRMCNFMLIDPRPAAIYCGKNKTMLYNEPYKLVTGQRHPYMMGKPFTLAWPEVQEFFLPEFDKACETGTAFIVDDARFHIERHGYIEETFYSIAISPFDLENGETAFYNPVFDTTRQVIAERRMAFLLRVNQAVASSRELEEFWHQLIKGLDVSNPDVPFALLYSVSRDADETMSILSESSSSFEDWDLEGSVAVPENLTSGWKNFRAEINDVEDFIPNFKALINSESHTLLRTENGSLPEIFSRDIPIEGGNQRCEAAVFLPIRLSPEKVLGFLIIGVNPRKHYDEDYDILIQLLSRQLATAMASTLLYEDEVRRSRLASEQAEKDKILLSGTIESQKLEAVEIESRFRRMSDLAPAGMFHMDAEGVLIYANDKYYDLTQLPRNALEPMSWYSVIDDQDHPLMDKEWATLMKGETVDFELRLKRPFATGEVVGGEKVEGSTWIIAAAYAEKDANQNLVGVLGCITDISRQKWAEGFQSRKRAEAIELKRQQENFIDMTSHEIRNPLSAIMQCADWIATSTSTIETQESAAFAELAESYADAAQTILLCASHQGRIIDDILVLSKLDSDLLVITPVDVQPTTVIDTAIKMFRGEMKKSGIEFSFTIEQSYLDLAVDWVKMDSNRFLQVLINLTANAIKFTQSEFNKEIEISIGASLDVPLTRSGVQYLPRGEKHRDLSEGTAWGTGKTIYLYVQVKDTGRGLDELERNFLFKRFSQSSPKTHIQYGGSGLGLFISRSLTELQGGQIGMSSTAGSGSTFAFYVRTRRAKEPTTKLSVSPLSVNKIAEETRILTNKALLAIQDSIHPPPPSIGTVSVTSAPAIRTAKPQKSESSKASIGHSPIIKHVLVVEDNLVNQRVLVKQLTLAGCTVHVANHGLEALTFLESSQFWFSKTISGIPLSVILMDIEMPVMDGLTCVRKIRQLQSEGRFICHLPVIAVTANARPEQIKTAQEAGVDSVVTKPFRIGELIPEIEKWCVGGKAREMLVHERSHSAPLLSGLSE